MAEPKLLKIPCDGLSFLKQASGTDSISEAYQFAEKVVVRDTQMEVVSSGGSASMKKKVKKEQTNAQVVGEEIKLADTTTYVQTPEPIIFGAGSVIELSLTDSSSGVKTVQFEVLPFHLAVKGGLL